MAEAEDGRWSRGRTATAEEEEEQQEEVEFQGKIELGGREGGIER